MNHPHEKNATPRWLIVESSDRRKMFVFRPGDEHTIVVGGDESAHFRLSPAAPVCFYVERLGDDLHLVPAYVGHLRLNSSRVTDSVRLPKSGVVEFGSHRLQLTVQAVPPGEDDVTVLLPAPPSHLEKEEPYDEALATRIAEFESAPDVHDAPTAVLMAPDAELSPNVTDTMDEDGPALATQIMGSIPDFEEAFPGYRDPSALEMGSEDPTLTDGISVHKPVSPAKVALGHAKPDDHTPALLETKSDRTEGIAFDDFVPPSGKSPAMSAQGKAPSDSANTPTSVAQTKSRLRKRASVLARMRSGTERFGAWAKEKPALAVGGGMTCALLLGLAVGGVSRVLSTPPEQTASPTGSAATASENTTHHDTAEQEASKEAPPKTAPPKPAETSKTEEPPSPEEAKAEAETRAAEEKAHAEEVNRAVEHLIAGRDDEAAHAYQSLAQTKYATEQLKRMSELMKQRTNAGHQKKPATHQVPDLYR